MMHMSVLATVNQHIKIEELNLTHSNDKTVVPKFINESHDPL